MGKEGKGKGETTTAAGKPAALSGLLASMLFTIHTMPLLHSPKLFLFVLGTDLRMRDCWWPSTGHQCGMLIAQDCCSPDIMLLRLWTCYAPSTPCQPPRQVVVETKDCRPLKIYMASCCLGAGKLQPADGLHGRHMGQNQCTAGEIVACEGSPCIT